MTFRGLQIGLMLLVSFGSGGQSTDSIPLARKVAIYSSIGLAGAGSLVWLDQAWFDNEPRGSFRFHNDNSDWRGMDKIGHSLTNYRVGQLGYVAFSKAGMNERNALIWGGSLGFFYMTVVEVMDGFSTAYGFSPGDMLANAGGAALFISQQARWKEQRIQLKFSARTTDYAALRPKLLGGNLPERILKDYNGQTYWLTAGPGLFSSESKWPRWLGISCGYGVDGLLGAAPDNPGNAAFQGVVRQSRWVISPDVLLEQIPWKRKSLKHAAAWLSFIKIPLPGLEYATESGWRFLPIAF